VVQGQIYLDVFVYTDSSEHIILSIQTEYEYNNLKKIKGRNQIRYAFCLKKINKMLVSNFNAGISRIACRVLALNLNFFA
jgi:hypothetical protein